MRKILLIGTGGTIACGHSEDGLKPLLTPEQLLSYVQDSKDFCETDTIQLMNLDSTNIEPKHWLAMAACIEAHYDEYDGFVICHGTDTMAFTAAALSYLIQHSPKPIVITGAQHPIDLEDTDARVNLMDSLRFAASEKAHDVCVVLMGKLLPEHVQRRSTARAIMHLQVSIIHILA